MYLPDVFVDLLAVLDHPTCKKATLQIIFEHCLNEGMWGFFPANEINGIDISSDKLKSILISAITVQ